MRKLHVWAITITILLIASVAAAADNYSVVIPYTVQEASFNTGINITIDRRAAMKMVVALFNDTEPYSVREVTLTPKGWTGLVNYLVEPGVEFRSPSTVVFIADGKFYITEVILSPIGFSHTIVVSAPER